MKRAVAASERLRTVKHLRNGLLLVVLFSFLAWALRVWLVNFDSLSDLTLAGVLNEGLRGVIFVGPVLIYSRYVERSRVLESLCIRSPRRNAVWVLPLLGALFVVWYLLLDNVLGDGRVNDVGLLQVLFTVLSVATLVEEIYFRGFLLNRFWQTMGFWRANLASSSLFALIHFPGWYALGKAAPHFAFDALGLLVFGMVFGWAMKKTGSLWSAYVLHALNNLLVVALLGS